MSGRVQDRVIVVTGAAGGQGAAEVAALRDEGAIVVATDVQSFAGEELERVHRCRLDVTSREDWAALAAPARDQFGRVDGLINNAGIASRARLGEVVLEEWNRALAINLTGPMLGIQALSPLMGAGASIVNVGSVAGLTAHYTAAYTASKWGLRGLTRLAAMELGPRGIRVNAVHPGYIETPMTATAPPAFKGANEALTPLGRVGSADEVAALMVFLMSDECAFLTGADIPVDGGLSSGGVAKSLSDSLAPSALTDALGPRDMEDT
ncbi:MAG: SDR family oxidoreductase [Solirubrobacterales bacterium]|nr:SDR family oxidoreductase [Solirubrobacterales bacterium]